MKCNIGKTDKIIRVIVGVAIIAVGIVPIVTAAIGWCGLYTALGISTCKTED